MKFAPFVLALLLLAGSSGNRSDLESVLQAALDSSNTQALLVQNSLAAPLRIHETVLLPTGVRLYQFGEPVERLSSEDAFFSAPGYLRFESMVSRNAQDAIVSVVVVGAGQSESNGSRSVIHLRKGKDGWLAVP